IGHRGGKELCDEGAAGLAAVDAELFDPQAPLDGEVAPPEKPPRIQGAHFFGPGLVSQQPVIVVALAFKAAALLPPVKKDISKMEAQEKGGQQGQKQNQRNR